MTLCLRGEKHFRLLAHTKLCYKPRMRNWVRERMRRRGKKVKNESESTGKVGQEKPAVTADQPAPLQPSYYTPATAPPSQAAPIPRTEQHGRPFPAERMQIVTQPESPFMPPAGPDEVLKQPTSPQSGQTAAPQEKRAPRGVVVLAIGLPGSGKTTWFKRRGVTPLSSDLLRSILFDDITEQRYQGLVFSTLRSLLRARLIAKMPWNYVDASNLSSHERRQWIKMARSFGYEVQALFFDVPLEVCMERNRRRERAVQEDVMRRMAEKLRAPSFREGFSKIVVVRVKKSESEPDGGHQERD
jgi:predicted kinase